MINPTKSSGVSPPFRAKTGKTCGPTWSRAAPKIAPTSSTTPPAWPTEARNLPPRKPLLRAGVYWPGAGIADLCLQPKKTGPTDAPVVPDHFLPRPRPRRGPPPDQPAHQIAAPHAGSKPAADLRRQRSKIPVSVATLEALFTDAPPSLSSSTAHRSRSAHRMRADDARASNPLAAPFANAAPIFQVVLSGASEASVGKKACTASPRATSR